MSAIVTLLFTVPLMVGLWASVAFIIWLLWSIARDPDIFA